MKRKEPTEMTTTDDVAMRAVPSGQMNGFAVAAFVLSLMGMFGSPILSGIIAVVGLRQIRRRGHQGFGLALAALAVSVAFTVLHIVMWVQSGHANFRLETASHW